MPQGRDGQASTGSGLWLHYLIEEISDHSCKYLPPLEAIKGEPGLTTETDPPIQTTHDHHTPSESTHTEWQSALCPPHQAETWDLALSRNLLVHPYYKHLWVQGNTDPRSHWT